MTARSFVILAAVIIALSAYLFLPEIGGLVWHLKHGGTAELNGLRFKVPLLYSVTADPKHGVLYMVSVPGRACIFLKRKRGLKVAMLSVYASVDTKTDARLSEVHDPFASHDYVKTIYKTANLGGDEGRCLGFTGPPLWDGDKDVEIDCEFHSHKAHFAGSEMGAEDFFRILETAQHSKRNH